MTRRFPEMNFAFLEGGVAWAAALYSDIVGHWEKRNLAALRAHLDPALVDRDLIVEMLGRYAPDARRLPAVLTRRPRGARRPARRVGGRAGSSGPRTSGTSSPSGSGSAARPTTHDVAGLQHAVNPFGAVCR